MRNVLRASALYASAAVWSLAFFGCDAVAMGDRDAGSLEHDAGELLEDAAIGDAGSIVLRDGGSRDGGSDPGEPCSASWDCEDWDACTTDACVAGACSYTPIADCSGCRSDAECSDGDPTTEDHCDTYTRSCSHFPTAPCTSPADCDDGNACTDDQCSPGTGFCAWGSIPDCCFRDSDCDDYDPCTADGCGSDHACAHAAIPGCGASPCDLDHDGHGSPYCYPAGDDCDDTNAAIHGGAIEICDDGLDDDCDGRRDLADESCAAGNTTCDAAIALSGTASTTGSVISTGSFDSTTCGESAFWTLELGETSDVTIHVRIHDFPPDPPPCSDCAPPDGPMQINFNAFLETACGDASTDVDGGSSGCYFWDPSGGGFFSGMQEITRTLRRVEPGSYTLEVQAREFGGWMPRGIGFDLDLTVVPSAAPECASAIALTEGATITGTTTGHADAFGLDCHGAAVSAPERVHTFTLDERRRVRIAAEAVVPDGSTYAPRLRLALLGACDADAERLACIEDDAASAACPMAAILEPVLDPGTYFVTAEGRDAGALDYALSYTTEALGAACAGAPVIAGSSSISGTTEGSVDHFRWTDAGCGGGFGPDVVYTLDVAASSRVVLDLVASYSGALLRVVSGCGETLVAGSSTRTHVDTTLEPGTYEVIVGGAKATDAGAFVLNTTILPM